MGTMDNLTLNLPGVRISNPAEAVATSTNNASSMLSNTRGSNVSGRGWKKVKAKKEMNDKILQKHKTWEQKEEIRKENNAIREFNKNITKIREKKRERAREQRKEAVERKKMNAEKGQVYQLIKNTKTIKKMSKKARKSLIKMPKAMFEEYLAGKKVKNLH